MALGVCVCLLLLALGAVLRRSRALLDSRLRDIQTKLEVLRSHDTLTGLMLRPEFELALDEAVHGSDKDGTPLCAVIIGLDNFRAFNDGYGHGAGDALLLQAAKRLAVGKAAGGDVMLALARWGGDEFALLLRLTPEAAGPLCIHLLQALQRPYHVEGRALHLSASAGIAGYPLHGSRPRLLGHAALAMRSVKQVGGGSHAVYDPALAVDQREQSEMLQDLRHAVERNELRLVYQPKVDARSLQITAAEALLRWEHPRRGTVSPTVFIPLAERHGLIAPIGRWVIDEACRQAAQWRKKGLRMRVAVNISGHQLRQDDLVQYIQAALRRHAIPAERMTCEITESVAMEDTAITRASFERLRRAGLHVSIDDFGTGHSSLAALRRLPAAELKIDRAFIVDLATSEQARSVVRAVVQLARTLEMRVVAEGVETAAQRDVLMELDCDELQGWLFAKPMSATAIALWADGDHARPGAAAMFRPSLFKPTQAAPIGD